MPGVTFFGDGLTVRDRAMKRLALSLGLANPLWLAYGGAAAIGASWWLIRRMAGAPRREAPPAALPSPEVSPIPMAVESPPALLEAPAAAVDAGADVVRPDDAALAPALSPVAADDGSPIR